MTETGSTSAAVPVVSGHQTSLDGIRAVAAFAVLLFHVSMETGTALEPGFLGGVLARGEIGVPIFFTLSGLLLYRPWAAEVLTGERTPDTRRYLWRRFFRIIPAYWLVVAVALLLWGEAHASDPWTWAQMLFLVHTYDTNPWWFGLGPKGLGQMWSLAVELSFYLTLPLMAAVLRWFALRAGPDLRARARRLLIGLAAFGAVSYAYTIVEYFPEFRPWMNVWLPRSWTFFVPGMALAVLTVWAREEDGRVRRLCAALASSWGSLWLIAGLAYLIASTPLTGPRLVGLGSIWTAFSEQALYTLIAFCLVAPAALGSERVHTLLGGRLMSYLGQISYGVFLWQFVVLYLWYDFTGQQPWTGNLPLNLVAVSALTVGLAGLTHRYVEEPARRLIRFVPQRAGGAGPGSPNATALRQNA
ncbi:MULTISPECIES: acyltransferase family protein [unclassified Nonomuraea]|uniref:acyltransferase family protein n=1 Tax=unclassified Nonomuraea TaxID=2593643 RepID=UPI00342D833F